MRDAFREYLAAHGLLFTSREIAAGLVDDETVARRVASGEWANPFPRTYLATPTPERRHLLRAAIAYAGPAAALSCHTAGEVLRLREFPATAEIHLTTEPRRHLRGAPGLVVHRSGLLLPRDTVVVDGLRVTNRARTLVDCARLPAHLAWPEVRAMWCAAVQSRRIGVDALAEELRRATLGRQQGRFAELVADLRGRSESELECAFRDFCRRFRLPQPRGQVWRPRALGGWARVDADVEGVLVELLGLAFHLDATSFEADILRRNELGIQDALAGDQRVRLELTYAALTGPRAVASAALLQRAIEAESRRRMARMPGDRR